MKSSSLKRNLLIGFGVSLIILIASTVASYQSINNLLDNSQQVSHTKTVVKKIEEILSVVKDAETGQRGFLLTGSIDYLDPYNGSFVKALKLVDDVKELTADNSVQQQRVLALEDAVRRRFGRLQARIDAKRRGESLDLNDLASGKQSMDSIRRFVSMMGQTEEALLKERTDRMNKVASYTPFVIMIAALLAIIITIIFYFRMNRDIDIRTKLQTELEDKEKAITKRIVLIQDVSSKISDGDYSVRVEDDANDELGGISTSLNRMAASLQTAFNDISYREWLQSGIAGLSEAAMGNDTVQSVSQRILNFLAEYTSSSVGALYINIDNKSLQLQTAYAADNALLKQFIKFGEGTVGQVALNQRPMLVENLQEEQFLVSFAAAQLKPVNIIVIPLVFENGLKAVIELGSLQPYTKEEQNFLSAVTENAATIINTVEAREKVQELLEETQSQAEELMSQQSELEQINAELETQAQQLQSSEEELKVQSEELIEANTLLEEKSLSLEQRNMLIQQKNDEIQKKAEDLALSTKYKSEFLANMSHELRTPLNSILLLSRLLSDNNEKNLSNEQVQYANVIQTSGKGLLQLIDEILDLSKIESGKMTVEHNTVNVKALTTDLKALFDPIANQANIDWQIHVHEKITAEIETDEMRLSQILKNLLSNAFKFTSKGSVQLFINPDQNREGFLCFSVKDTGIGISPEKQDLIFEAFQQEDGSTRRKYGGTGLGLSISRELAKLLGGEIKLSSTQGEGSEFTLCIPEHPEPVEQVNYEATELFAKPVPETTSQQPARVEQFTPAIPDDRNNITAGDKVILIIEDDVNFATILADYARQKQYKVLVSVRGDEGIELAKKYLPGGILLDIQLPVKNGWQVMDELKKNSYTRFIPVHMMSVEEAKNESISKGAIDFITKPVPFEQLNNLFDKIEYVLSHRQNKVLILEDNYKHAKALAYYLGTYNVNTEIFQTAEESIESLQKKEENCVIFDISLSDKSSDRIMQLIRKEKGLEELPIILFTGKNLSQPEEFRLKQFADAIVVKTANSYQRILDEVTLFLHLVQQEQDKIHSKENFERSVIKENVLKGKNVLLADDDVRNIYSMTRALEKYQMKVIPAMDGKEALELLRINKIDVILMDMMMPQMDGYESIKGIRKLNAYKNLPVIAVTAKAMAGDREKCIAAGASDYISKPVDMDQLVSLLRIWLYE